MNSASGVAQAVYKRRKDIQTLAGIKVDETGIGSGEVAFSEQSVYKTYPSFQDVVPVESSQRDRLFLPILAVCAITICALLSILAATLVGRARQNKSSLLPQTVDKSSTAYEELCRQRMGETGPSSVVVGNAGERSKHSSTSSWPGDEMGPLELDIGTGRELLASLQQKLERPEEISRQWESLRDYAASDAQTQAGLAPENADKNLDSTTLPCERENYLQNYLVQFR